MIKKILSAATAAALGATTIAVVSYAAPPVEGAVLVKSESDLAKELLGSTVEEADSAYLLGISNLFNVFLENDFTPKGSDCEGRLAIGGSMVNKGEYNNYMVGCALTGYAPGVKDGNYAEYIVLGENLSRVSFGNGSQPQESTTVGGTPNWWYDRPRNIVISENTGVKNGEGNDFSTGDLNGSTIYYSAENDPIINFEDEFTKLSKTSFQLASYDGVDAVYEGDTLYMTATENDIKVNGADDWGYIFFDVESNWIENAKNVYVNVPENCYVVMNISGSAVNTYDLNFSNSASYGDGNAAKPNFYFNNKQLGEYEQLENNVDEATLILANFYEASSLYISNSFIGTILAPNADVEGTWGHLSGSLIAKSFEGETEFGYKTFKGSALKKAIIDDSSSEEDSSSVEDSSSEDDTSSVEDSSSEDDTSSVEDSSSEDDTSSVEDSSSEDDTSSVEDSSSEDDTSSVEDSSSEDDTSSVEDSSSEDDTSSVEDSSSEDDTSSVEDSSSEDDTSSVEDSSSDDDTSSVEDSSSEDDTSSVEDSSSEDDTSSVEDSSSEDETGSIDDTNTSSSDDSNTDSTASSESSSDASSGNGGVSGDSTASNTSSTASSNSGGAAGANTTSNANGGTAGANTASYANGGSASTNTSNPNTGSGAAGAAVIAVLLGAITVIRKKND